MELIARAYLNKLIKEQFNIKSNLNKDDIYKLLKIKPYKKEGKTLLYKVKDVQNAGITYSFNFKGFYPIPKFGEKFWISKDGKILNVNTGQLCKTYIGTDGYEHVILRFYGKNYRKRVHSLMGKVFLGNPQVVNHKDGNKANNNLKNLERSTHQKNNS